MTRYLLKMSFADENGKYLGALDVGEYDNPGRALYVANMFTDRILTMPIKTSITKKYCGVILEEIEIEESKREMTIEEIEEELGYKIKIKE